MMWVVFCSGFGTQIKNKRKREEIERFLDMEAEVSQDNSGSEGEDDNLESQLPGFIDNATQPALATQMTPG